MSRAAVRLRPGLALALTLALLALSLPTAVSAGGYDTPILYTARHQGMGGTAIGHVDDPSAMFHNPAGLQGTEGVGLIADFSLLFGHVQASPDLGVGVGADSVESSLTVAPFFLLGAAYRAHPWLTLGLGFYPVASGGASYEYDNLAGNPTEDITRVVFLELTPGASLNLPPDLLLPGNLSLGVGYRVDSVSFTRKKGPPGNPVVIDLELAGIRATGVRVGLQWQPDPGWGLGLVWRNRVEVVAEGDRGVALDQEVLDPSLRFVLPSKLGVGGHAQLDALAVALDLEYGFYSENGSAPLTGTIGGVPGEVSNVFRWHDGVTARVGLEYAFGRERRYPVRAGYVFDAKVTNERFPSAFGTPPAPTHSLTTGAGYRADAFEVNLAYAHRFGSAVVDQDTLAPATECRFCSRAGDYALGLHGLYVDVSTDF